LRHAFLATWGLLLAAKLWLVLTLQPFGDEAFYWWEGQHPAWAYSDLPGLTAWLTRLGTELAGDTAFGLRWPFLLLGALIPWLVVRIAARWFGAEAGWRAGLLALPLPLMLPLGVLALPDVPLTFAALLCLDACAALLRRVDAGAALRLALGLAMGALAHYRFAPILAGLALGFLLAGGARRLGDPRVLAALAAGAAAWLPLLRYNLGSEAVGLRFQLLDRHPWSYNPLGLLQPVGQALAASPLLYALCLWALWRAVRHWRRGTSSADRQPWGLVLGMAGLLTLLYAGLAPFADRARVSFHWPLPAYLALLPILPALLDERLGRRARRWEAAARRLAWAVTLAVFAWLAAAASPFATARLAGTQLYPDNFLGWREIAAEVRPRLDGRTHLVADNFMLAAELALALDRAAPVYSLDHLHNRKHGRARQLADWGYDEAALLRLPAGSPVLLVVEDSAILDARMREAWRHRLCRLFTDITARQAVTLAGGAKRFSIYTARTRPAAAADCPVAAP
jgi:4-amino-4-deoxy-L-arabinose transferase-like glycosyltransferase